MRLGTVADDTAAMGTKEAIFDTEENREVIDDFFANKPSTSIRKAASELGVPRSTLHRIVKGLKLHSYKIQILQPLNENHIEQRMQFAMEMNERIENHTIAIDDVWFSDEAYFQLDGYVNKQNYRFWGRSRPEITIVNPLHPQKVLVWCAISAQGVFGPIFIDGTLNSQKYVELLKREFFPFIRSMGHGRIAWFMQDGARPHRTAEVFEALNSVFDDRVIGLDYPEKQGGGLSWPPFSPDLNPCDYFLWGFLKDKVFEKAPQSISDLKLAITTAVQDINSDQCAAVLGGFRNRLTAIIAKDGGHFEPLYH